ncbi:phage holin family protein [uncultured Clostridium sp.]|uniref:phage holin family protein n=1 Tax=uncultured Clostridium sp. TaxID=59620 RepID=UPI0028E5E911|nr:phage holin family protein [uncultured Clostridium sp.]
MDYTNLVQFIPESLFIVVAAIYVVGMFLKKLDSIPDKYITSILMLFGITFAVLLSIINAQVKVTLDVIVNGVLQGVLCWGVAVGLNQTGKQLNKQE